MLTKLVFLVDSLLQPQYHRTRSINNLNIILFGYLIVLGGSPWARS